MHVHGVAAATLAVFLCAGTGLAAPPAADGRAPRPELPLEGVTTQPDWVRRPTGAQMMAFYPAVAATVGIEGHVVLQCSVLTTGAVSDCRVLQESPVGMRFGDAARSLAQFFQMKPATQDGVPVAGSRVVVPIGFDMPTQVAGSPAADADAGAVSPRQLELARKVAVLALTPGWERSVGMAATSLNARFANTSLTEQEQTALEEYTVAMRADIPGQIDRAANIYARGFSEKDLEAMAAFFASPAGRAWLSSPPEVSRAMQTLFAQMGLDVQAQVRRAFCAKYACNLATAPMPPR